MGQTAENPEQLKQAAQLVFDFYETCNDSKRDDFPMVLFRVLAELTLDYANQNAPLEKTKFYAKEIKEKIIEIKEIKSKESDAEWIRKRWKELKDELEQRKPHIQIIAKQKGLEFYPWIDKDELKNSPSYYYLIIQKFSEQEKLETTEYPCPEGDVRYITESLTDIPRRARWIEGLILKGWRKFAYIIPPILILLSQLILVALVLLLGIYTQISTVKWLTFLIASSWIIWEVLSAPLYQVASKRIVIASDWMIPFKETRSVQLELRKIDIDKETGRPIRELRLVIYSAKCPICSGRIEVESGGLQFPFRLVGKCLESPREHIFSFDHVTKIGRYLMK